MSLKRSNSFHSSIKESNQFTKNLNPPKMKRAESQWSMSEQLQCLTKTSFSTLDESKSKNLTINRSKFALKFHQVVKIFDRDNLYGLSPKERNCNLVFRTISPENDNREVINTITSRSLNVKDIQKCVMRSRNMNDSCETRPNQTLFEAKGTNGIKDRLKNHLDCILRNPDSKRCNTFLQSLANKRSNENNKHTTSIQKRISIIKESLNEMKNKSNHKTIFVKAKALF